MFLRSIINYFFGTISTRGFTDVGRRPPPLPPLPPSTRDVMAPFETFAGNRRIISVNDRRSAVFTPMEIDEGPADDKELIQVSKVDLENRKNAETHHTDKYALLDVKEDLIIRRGQEFNITVNFNRPYDQQKDDLRIVFQFGENPKPSLRTHAEFILSDRDKPKEWGAFINNTDGNALSLVLNTPPTCAVGKWSLKIDVVKRRERGGVDVFRYTHTSPVYILFNPWCRDDLVYMYEEDLLQEYVLNEAGKIFAGSSSMISPKPWVFGQFEENILDCAVYILEKSNLLDHIRGDPIKVVRKISQLVNAPDDGGVLVGNWSGSYEDGTSPLSWNGSVAILNQYYKTKQPVQYGQCWVFSGVVTTVCRALGIPARSVTNFASAHDTDGSITIDYYFDGKFKPIEDLNSDSVWNFHVWNDVWLARPDLPAGYGGWQVIDATPQETSEGIFCLGPMPVLAVKRGEVFYPYDGPFVFAEVNADRFYWKEDADGTRNIVKVRHHAVGKFISTKQVNGNNREDITDQYKFVEGTDEERTAVRRANLSSTKKGLYEQTAEDVTFDLSANPDTFMGDTMEYTLKLKNTSTSERTINGTLYWTSIYYTGVVYKTIKEHGIDGTKLKPNEESSIKVIVEVDEYLRKLTDHCFTKISCMCSVDETGQTFVDLEELRLRKPHLSITAPDTVATRNTFEVEVSFVNPLPETLKNCELRVEGPGIHKSTIYKQPNVEPKEKYTSKFEMTADKPGDKEIIIYFNCDQIYAVTGDCPIKISL